jgi:hypothetical protein
MPALGARLLALRDRHGRACLFFAATWALVSLLPIHAPVHLDTARDLLLARDCALEFVCEGPRSSFGGWSQGALWTRVLALREVFGLDLAAIERIAHVALAAGAALLPAAARSLGREATTITWAVWFAATAWTIGYPIMWNPTLWPLALGLAHLLVFRAVQTRRSLPFVGAAVALAIAVDLHVASAILIPFHLAVVVATAVRPMLVAASAVVVAVGILRVASPAAFVQNWGLVASYAHAVVLVVVLAAATGWALRRHLASLVGSMRAEWTARGLCVYLGVVPPVLALAADHQLHARYLAPVIVPAVLLAAPRSAPHRRESIRRSLITILVVVLGYVSVWIGDRILNPRFRLVEVDAVADELYGRGLSFADLYQRLRGPDTFHLLATLAAVEPLQRQAVRRDGGSQLVLRVRRADLPDPLPVGWSVAELDSSHVAVVVPYEPWVQLDTIEVCTDSPQVSDALPTCSRIEVDPSIFRQGEGMRWADRAYPSLPGLRRPRQGDRVSYRMRLRPNGDAARDIRLFPDRCKGWRIEQAAATIDPTATSARVDKKLMGGEIVFSVVAGPGCRWWWPPFAEIRVGDSDLASVLTAAGAAAQGS